MGAAASNKSQVRPGSPIPGTPTKRSSSPTGRRKATKAVVVASTEHSGSVRFQGAARHVARWVKLPTSCDAASVGNLLLRDWRLQPPSAVVTLVGPNCAADAVGITAPDAAGIGPEQVSAMTLEEGLRLATDLPLQEFRDGLRGALRVSNAWLITDGVSEGVGGLIGRPRPTGGEVEDLPCLGIASWEKVAQRGELAKARTGRCVMYENPKGTSYAGPDDLHLQPRHSHFLLLEDDARGGKGDGRGRLRKGLENFINEEDLSGDGVKTPIVLLVVNGGAETLERLCDALSEEPQDPILIVAGTGGAADDIFAYHNWRSRQEGESRTQGDSGVPGEHEAAQWLAAGPGRSAAYLDAARRLVPRIYERGQQKGHNSKAALGFYSFSRGYDDADAFKNAILASLLESCSNGHRPAPVLGASRRASRPAVTRYIERNAPPAGLQPPASNPSPSRAAVTAPPSTSTPLVPPSYTEAFLASLPGAGTADAGQRAARTGAEAGEIGSAPP